VTGPSARLSGPRAIEPSSQWSSVTAGILTERPALGTAVGCVTGLVGSRERLAIAGSSADDRLSRTRQGARWGVRRFRGTWDRAANLRNGSRNDELSFNRLYSL
ncbi:MAG: hypothetical protein P8182_04610, partial [Deltaproteobacteria bacterium]